MNVIFFGFKGSGKTTLGKKMALNLNRPFVDTDEWLEQHYFQKTKERLSFQKIFKKLGEPAFRKLEWDVLQSLKGIQDAVISIGGGSILSSDNAAFLAKLGQLVYLKVSKETLKMRILGKAELPAYLNPIDPEGSFEQMYKKRQVIYEKIHALSVDLEVKTEDQIILEISTLIQSAESAHGK